MDEENVFYVVANNLTAKIDSVIEFMAAYFKAIILLLRYM